MSNAKRICAVEECGVQAIEGGRCRRHTKIFRLHGITHAAAARPGLCQVEGCAEGLFSKKYCLAHEVRCLRLRERHENQLTRISAVKAALYLAGRAINARGRVNDHGEVLDVKLRRNAG